MSIWRSVFSGVKAWAGKTERNQEISDELQSFLEASVEEKVRRGLNREQALQAARIEIGSAETVRHKMWAAGWESTADAIWQDVRFGTRQLLKSPGFSIVAIVSLALGIGANTAIFTLINDLLLKSLPVRDPQQLVSFGRAGGGGTLGGLQPGPVEIFSYDFYKQLEAAKQDQLQGICGFGSFPVTVNVRSEATGGAATQASTQLVSGTFFAVVGAEPMLGRTIHAEDVKGPGQSPVAVISYRYWQQSLAADPAVVGRMIRVHGTAFTVIGVMSSSFYGVDLNEESPDMWLPITMQREVMLQPSLLDPGGFYWMHVMARRNPAVSVQQAQEWVNAQWQHFMVEREGGSVSEARRHELSQNFVPLIPAGPGISHLRSAYEAPLAILMAIVGVVLLIACANLANFLLAKAASREREFSTRMALGSSRSRIIRQVLTETLLLSFLGGVLGLALAFWGTKSLIHFMVGDSTRTALAATPDLHVLAFTSGICLVTGLLFGLAPALRISRIKVAGALNATSRTTGAGGGRSGRLLPKTLVTVQVVLCLVLLTVAGLFVRTLHNLRSQELGFDRTNILVASINPKFANYQPDQLNALYERLLSRLNSLPGVRMTTISGAPLMSRGSWGSPITILGRQAKPEEDVSTLLNRVGPGYFETVGIPLIQGRTIGAQDTASSIKAVVVNQTMAERYFPHGDAVGHNFTVEDPSVKGTWQIVGVVRDAKYNSPGDRPAPMAYLAVMQLTADDQYAYWLQLRTAGDPAAIVGEVRSAVAEIDGNLSMLHVQTISEEVDDMLTQQKLVSQLATFFSLLALLLSCIGLYGVMTYSVLRRTNEIGVRMALGAPAGQVLWMVLKESLVLLLIGLALGAPLTVAANRAVQAGLFGLGSFNLATLIGAATLMCTVTIIAAYFPARRASRIDPMVALRYE